MARLNHRSINRPSLDALNHQNEGEDDGIFEVADEREEESDGYAETRDGESKLNFNLSGLAVSVINDYGDQFYPVIRMDINDIEYMKTNIDQTSFTSQANITAALEYYNLKAGVWEPALEGLNFKLMYDQNSMNKIIQIKAEDPIDVNVSPELIEITYTAYLSWEKFKADFEEYKL